MILVTGCAGFIGSHLCASLAKEGKEIVGVDNFDSYYDIFLKKENIKDLEAFKNFSFIKADITHEKEMLKILREFQFSQIVHLAARPGVSSSLANPLPYVKINIYGTFTLLEIIRKTKIIPFIFVSSSSVYGGTHKIPFSEKETLNIPLSPYGLSKLSAENFCCLYHQFYGIPVTILRLFTVYGERIRPDMALIKFTKAIEQGMDLTLYNGGEVERDYTYIEDIVSGIKKAMNLSLSFEIINLGNNKPVKLKEMVKLLEKHLRKKAKIKFAPLPKGEMSKTWADITRAQEILNWQPKVDIEEGIERFIRWYLRKF